MRSVAFGRAHFSAAEYLGVGNRIDALCRPKGLRLTIVVKSCEKVAKVSAKARG
jgi:hypothetical protein